MSIKKILLPTDGKSSSSHVYDMAFALAELFGAEIGVLLPQQLDWQDDWLGNYGLSPEEARSLNERAAREALTQAHDAEKTFRANASQHPGVTVEFNIERGRIGDLVTRYAQAADLAVLGVEPQSGSRFWQQASDSVLFRSGRPAFLAPSRPVPEALGSRVVIAWKESREAARTVSAALPFIEAADEVSLVTVTDDEEFRPSLERIEKYLMLHRSDVTLDILNPGNDRTGKVLIDAAAEKPGTILVMGAYGHRRWEERIFGGVTEYIIKNTDVPVLMAH